MELSYIDKFPVNRLFAMVFKIILFFFAYQLCLVKSMQLILCINKPQLFIKLGRMVTGSADDPVNEFCEVPIHGLVRS